ncbi:CACNA1H [Symbiodinium natans]|uniref:CACNA1H protein n=1 Tax=Symbiodinium natans TaxID=878477 RepID=A0A812I7T0_9DINO|nr:CACNA1H [Symbiodinium natans]
MKLACCSEAEPAKPERIPAEPVQRSAFAPVLDVKMTEESANKQGPSFSQIRLSLSGLHLQQEQALAMTAALIEEVDLLQFGSSFQKQLPDPPVQHKEVAAVVARMPLEEKAPVPLATAPTPKKRYKPLLHVEPPQPGKSRSRLDWDGGFRVYFPALCLRIVSSRWFDYLIGFVILVNSLLVGFEVQMSLDGLDVTWMQPLDTGFIGLYFLELCMRLVGMGWRQCFCDGWFLLDFTLVVLGIVTVFVLLFGSSGDLGILESVLVVRAMRLLRLIRALRMLKYFRTVWRLVYGLLTSHNAMFSTLSLILLTLYVFACLGVELITKDENLLGMDVTSAIIQDHFVSVFVSMLTLVQFVTVDSVAIVYVPLIKEKPILAVYFFAIILIVSIALMNLVTAVLVEGALENAAHDREAEKVNLQEKLKEAVPKLREVFAAMDANGDGNVTMEEIEAVPMDVIPKEFFEKNNVSSMQEIFEVLDVDGGGELSQEEFVDGLLDIFFRDVPLETVQTLKMLRMMECRLQVLKDTVDVVQQKVLVLRACFGEIVEPE